MQRGCSASRHDSKETEQVLTEPPKDAVGPRVPYADHTYIETGTYIGKTLQVGPVAGWKVANAVDFRLALLGGVDYRAMTGPRTLSNELDDGTVYSTNTTCTRFETSFRWDVYVSADWWFTERMAVGLYGSSQGRYLFDRQDKHFGLTFSFKL